MGKDCGVKKESRTCTENFGQQGTKERSKERMGSYRISEYVRLPDRVGRESIVILEAESLVGCKFQKGTVRKLELRCAMVKIESSAPRVYLDA